MTALDSPADPAVLTLLLLVRRRPRPGDTYGTFTCLVCGLELPLVVTGSTVVVHLDRVDVEAHLLTHHNEGTTP